MSTDVVPPEDGAPGSFPATMEKIAPPINGHHVRLSSRYDAARRVGTQPHVGDDLVYEGGENRVGNPIYSPINGTVRSASTASDGTSILEIQDSHGNIVRILHMDKFKVHQGQSVAAGQQVGTEGHKGPIFTPTHIHVDVMNEEGDHLDPEHFFGGGDMPSQPGMTMTRYPPYYPGVHMHSVPDLDEDGVQRVSPRTGKPKFKYMPYQNDPPILGPGDGGGSTSPGTSLPPTGESPASPPPEVPLPPARPPSVGAPSGQPDTPMDIRPPGLRRPYDENGTPSPDDSPMPPYADNDKNKRLAARRDDSNKMVTKNPDVCLTPRGGCMVPVAYNSVAHLGSSERLSPNVHINKQPDFHLNSRSKKIEGHSPGVGRGQTVEGYRKYSHVMVASSSVFSNGWAEVRDQDPAWINHPYVGPVEPSRPMKTIFIPTIYPVA